MITETDIRKLTDYIILNAYSINSSGFYNGKAGLSLCLFEIARLLKDNYIEDHAFELIQESLISKNDDISFENGLSGIGYVLSYLVKYEYVDADFNELFGSKQEKVHTYLKGKIIQKGLQLPLFTSIYFLEMAEDKKKKYDTIDLIISVLESVSYYLNEQFELFHSDRNPIIKWDVLKLYTTFLKLVTLYIDMYNPMELIHKYSDLYKRNKIACNYIIGFYMQHIASLFQDTKVLYQSKKQVLFAMRNINPQTLSLTQQIDLLYLLNKDEQRYKKEINYLENSLFCSSGKKLEATIIQNMNTNSTMCGYESGIARLLLYIAFKENKICGNNILRFDRLFK